MVAHSIVQEGETETSRFDPGRFKTIESELGKQVVQARSNLMNSGVVVPAQSDCQIFMDPSPTQHRYILITLYDPSLISALHIGHVRALSQIRRKHAPHT